MIGQVLHPERLQERADNLDAAGLNGIRMAYVTLDTASPPQFAWLDVEFFNDNALAPLPDPASFRVAGRVRRDPAGVQVMQVLADPGGNPRGLRLQLAPVGDYLTYVLSLSPAGVPAPGNALALAMDPLFNALPFKFRPGCFNISCAPPSPGGPRLDTAPAIDYLARDYDSFRHVLMAAMSARVPGWQPTSEADLDQVLIDLIAARGDELADAHDRVMAERGIGSARKRVSLARHARLVDYHIHQGQQATTAVAVQVAGTADLPPVGTEAFAVWNGPDWQAKDAVVFARFQDRPRWRQRVFPELNDLRLYTWGDTVSALEAGATEADLTPAGLATQVAATNLRDLLRGSTAAQAGAPADVDARVDRLLLEEVLNPATGTDNGRDIHHRQVLRLLPGPERAEVMQDPLTGDWFCRVRWQAQDALRSRYCFTVDCGAAPQVDACLFYGNLVDMGHGRPRRTVFPPPGAPLPATGDTQLVATHAAHWQPRHRPRGSEPRAPDGVVAVLPRDASIEPLAYRPTPPGGDVPPRSTLVVQVSGFAAPWSERIDLVESDGGEEHFIVETDEMQDSRIRFGDGRNGAPLPPQAVLTCRYQTGGGVAGNVGCDTLTTSNLPLLRVWNPLDVDNGLAPESRDDIIRRAPEAYRVVQKRCVTLADYARAAERIAGVAHARARYAWCGSWRAAQVVVDPVGRGAPTPDLVMRLRAALEALRLIGDDVEIRAPADVPLDVKLVLCAHPAYWIEDLRAVLEREFSDEWLPDGRPGFFHPDLWTFGQSLHASQLIGRALSVQGVDRVLRVSMRRFNPGVGGGLVTVTLQPGDLPESLVEKLDIGPFEILVVANDPDRLAQGRITFEIHGGRR